ncbi:MAG: peptidylprolyl isomerase [Gammaproteobacteria bacterium]|nr:peptidylprolyl isomerase [Gammaproteobacteria bacterium]MCY4355917.1 peptidylprolyl isomerase [Gammaproteobacteria bacterium]
MKTTINIASTQSNTKTFALSHLVAGALLSIVLVSAVSAQQRMLLDKIVAIVDRDVVLQSELVGRLNDVRGTATREGRQLPPESQLREEILEALILENIQMQFAERASIRYDDDTINRVMTNMAQENNMSFEQYVRTLESAGVYLRTREQVRRQLTMQELQRGAVNSRIHVTEQEIDNFLNSEMGQAIVAADYLIDHILVPVAATDSDQIKNDKLGFAADMVARLEQGDSIVEVRSEALESQQFPIDGTNFAWRKLDQLPSLFARAVEPMDIGEVEGPIEAGNGFHIIQLRDKRGGTEQIVKQTNIRHIMLAPNEIRNEQQTIEQIHDFRRSIIEEGEDFAEIARQNSDDASSVVAGGDLDWVSEGGMPVEMEAVVDELEVGEVSEPFRSQMGWHIAEVLGRRDTDLSQDYTRSQAYNTLRNRKFDLELQNWLIEIREEAFVELVD